MYLATGTITNLITFLLGKSSYGLGASGSIVGLMGALTSYYYFNRQALGRQADSSKYHLLSSIII